MKKNTFNMLLLIIFWACGIANADNICPQWNPGSKWTVKAVYHAHPGKNEWSEPVYWEYSIAECNEKDSQKQCIVDVKDRSEGLNLTARFTYRLHCGKISCDTGECNIPSLIKAEITKIRRGKQILKTLTYKTDVPVQTEHTLIPYDTPVFPLQSSAPARSSADFTVIKEIGKDLRTKTTIRQEVRQIKEIKDIPELSGEKNLTEVTCVTGNKRTVFTQYWRKGIPWALFGKNENMMYWLVEK